MNGLPEKTFRYVMAFGLLLSGCNNATSSLEFLNSLSSRPSFSGNYTTSLTITSSMDPLFITGECDKHFANLEWMTNDIPWQSPGVLASGPLNDLDCSDGNFTIDLTSTSNIISISFGETKEIQIRGSNQLGIPSEISIVNVTLLAPVTSPVAVDISDSTFEDNSSYSITLNFSDPQSDSATSCSTFNTANLSVNACTCFTTYCLADISFPSDFNGAASFDFNIIAGSEVSNTATASITVTPVNDAPTYSSSCLSTATEDSGYNCTITWSDIDGDTLSYSQGAAHSCSWLTVASDGTATGTPTNSDVAVGTCNLSISADDGNASPVEYTQSISLNNVTPTLSVSVTPTLTEDSPSSVVATDAEVQASDEGSGNYSLDYSTSTCDDPAGSSLSINTTTGEVQLTPGTDFSGSCLIQVVFDDGNPSGTVSAGFNVSITGVNDSPSITAADFSLNEDQSGGQTFTISDVDDSLNCSIDVTATSSNQSILNDSNISITGTAPNCSVNVTPEANANGSITLNLIVTDSDSLTDSSNVNLTFNPVNDPPVLTASSCENPSREFKSFGTSNCVSATDVEGDSLTWSLSGSNTCSFISINSSDGTLSGTPGNSDIGTCILGIQIDDGNAGTDTIDVAADVKPFCDSAFGPFTNFNHDGSGSISEPYKICHKDQLEDFATNVSGCGANGSSSCSSYIYLMSDIDYETGEISMIGSNPSPFSGYFDGLNHTIRNGNINQSGQNDIGFFSSITGDVRNLNLEDITVTGNMRVGILVGRVSGNAIIDNINITATSPKTLTGELDYIGGIFGYWSSVGNGSLTNSSVGPNITVSGNPGSHYVGGVGGYVFTSSNTVNISTTSSNATILGDMTVGGFLGLGGGAGLSINDCHAHGSVSPVSGASTQTVFGGFLGRGSGIGSVSSSSATGNVTGISSVGGFVGEDTHTGVSNYDNVSSTGNVTGSSFAVGGLAGKINYASFQNCFSHSQVEGNSSVGGLIGDYANGSLSKCFATGNVRAYGTAGQAGGLIGILQAGSVISETFALGDVLGLDSSESNYRPKIGGLVGTLLNTGEIYDSFARGSAIGSQEVGGLIGYWNIIDGFSGKIHRNYATGVVKAAFSGIQKTGGFVGHVSADDLARLSEFSYNYWNVRRTQMGVPAGDDVEFLANQILPYNDTEMQTPGNFSPWDFSNIWEHTSGQHPRLQAFISDIPDITGLAPIPSISLKGLTLWLDADDSDPQNSSNLDIVSSSKLQIWFSRHNSTMATQFNSSLQPDYGINLLNGLKTTSFGKSQLHQLSTNIKATDNFSIFVVFEPTSLTKNSAPIGTNDGTNWNYINVTSINPYLGGGIGSINNSVIRSSHLVAPTPHLGSLIGDVNTYELYLDGNLEKNGSYTTQIIPKAYPFKIGVVNEGSPTSSTMPFDGDIAEILVYNRKVSTSERNQIESYLNSKWGELGLPPAPSTHHIAFVTSTSYTGNLGGLAGAEYKCLEHSVAAGLQGYYRPILARSSDDVYTMLSLNKEVRLADNSSLVSNSPSEFWNTFSTPFINPIQVTEDGVSIYTGDVWSNVSYTGSSATSFDCVSWTNETTSFYGQHGTSNITGIYWGNSGSNFCNTNMPIYCISD